MVARYGDWVLLKPPFKASTLVLWLGPLGIAGLAGLMYWNFFRRQPSFQDNAGPPTKARHQSPATTLKEG